MVDLPVFYKFIIWAIPVIFAITVHEVGHGWVAKELGDDTAEKMGRLTLNPFRHIDPIGTVVVPSILFFLGGFIFGWAKPVPVNWQQLNHPRRDMALVALAGPAANLAMIIIWIAVAKLFLFSAEQGNELAQIMILMAWAGVVINSILMILNLFPLPPLDGSRVVYALLPPQFAQRYARLEPYGLVLLLALFVSGVLGKFISPLINGLQTLLFGVVF